jgi:hypothetical protein
MLCAMGDVSERLQRRIARDFSEPGSAAEVSRLVGEASDSERVQAAIVFVASGDLGRLRNAIALAQADWRDVLVAGELADDDWRQRLFALLGGTP